MAEWQPIETGPQDGERCILALANGSVVLGFYGPKYSTYGVNYGDTWGYGTGWNHSFGSPPTHWMPLPDPPKATVDEAEKG